MVEFIVTLIVLGFLGILDTGHLIWKSREKQPLVCPTGENCNLVLKSKYSEIFGIKNEVLGFLFYIFIFGSGIFLFSSASDWASLVKTALLIASSLGALFSLILIFVQIKILKNYCFYCLASALITFLIFLNVLGL